MSLSTWEAGGKKGGPWNRAWGSEELRGAAVSPPPEGVPVDGGSPCHSVSREAGGKAGPRRPPFLYAVRTLGTVTRRAGRAEQRKM